MSAFRDNVDKVRGFQTGAVDYINEAIPARRSAVTKPPDNPQLAKSLNKITSNPPTPNQTRV
jgi:hypothetical protein